ncbi:hypothetical protein C8R46DRAFT_516496 [Mycena filopes]|nr:hypothetical protein C8R46DRAFT_516496 [Mycena filopes]
MRRACNASKIAKIVSLKGASRQTVCAQRGASWSIQKHRHCFVSMPEFSRSTRMRRNNSDRHCTGAPRSQDLVVARCDCGETPGALVDSSARGLFSGQRWKNASRVERILLAHVYIGESLSNRQDFGGIGGSSPRDRGTSRFFLRDFRTAI